MNANSPEDPNRELAELLGQPPSHAADPVAQELARAAALDAFRKTHANRRVHLQRNLLLAAVLVMTGFIAGLLLRPQPGESPSSAASLAVVQALPAGDAAALLANGRDLFGNQIEAVVVDQGDVKWFLADGQRSDTGAPYRLFHFVDPQTRLPVSVITTSGGRFSIGSDRQFEILEGAGGNYIVTGPASVIENDQLTIDALTM